MKTTLESRALEPCPTGTTPLSGDSLNALVTELPTWQVIDGRLVRAFACENFASAMALANRLLPVVEDAYHHPDLLVRWGELRVTMWTHSIGGLHVNDFIVAARIEAALGQ
jgi:4a-hydroxytetrahydrobiopterin dehydratase